MIQSKLLAGVPHAFFGREGGVSKGIYASLNCGPGSGDEARDVRENRRRAAGVLGFGVDRLCTLYQVHSPNVIVVTKTWGGPPPQADGMVTKIPGLLLGILTADCTPVLFADAKAGVVGAAHAGWKGALSGVLETTLQVMGEQGASIGNIVAAIGPTIGPQSYEVGPEFRDRFIEADKGNGKFFSASSRSGYFLFDLPTYVAQRLTRAGLREIEQTAMDTLEREDQYFSYRRTTLRSEKDYGRQLSAIGLKGEK